MNHACLAILVRSYPLPLAMLDFDITLPIPFPFLMLVLCHRLDRWHRASLGRPVAQPSGAAVLAPAHRPAGPWLISSFSNLLPSFSFFTFSKRTVYVLVSRAADSLDALLLQAGRVTGLACCGDRQPMVALATAEGHLGAYRVEYASKNSVR